MGGIGPVTGKWRTYGLAAASQAIARLIYMGASFAAFVVIARTESSEVIGHYSLALAVISIAIAAADFGTTTVVGAELVQQEIGRRAYYLGGFFKARMLAALIVAPFLAASVFVLPTSMALPMVFAALLLPLIAARFFDPIFQIYAVPHWAIWPAVVHAAVLLVTTFGALWLLDDPDPWLIGSFFLAGAAYGITGAILTGRLAPLDLSPPTPEVVGILKRATSIGLSTMVSMMNARIGVILLASLRTPLEVGLYSAAFRFFELGAAVCVTAATPLIPMFSSASEHDRPHVVGRVFLLTLSLCVPCAMVAPLLSEFVVGLLYGPDFAASAAVVNVSAWLLTLLAITMIMTFGIVASGHTRFATPVSVASVTGNAVVSLLLIPDHGIMGAAAGAICGEAVAFLLVLGYALRIRAIAVDLSALAVVLGWSLALGLAVHGLADPLRAITAACLIIGFAVHIFAGRIIERGGAIAKGADA